jgi:hypothetical protein
LSVAFQKSGRRATIPIAAVAATEAFGTEKTLISWADAPQVELATLSCLNWMGLNLSTVFGQRG